MGKSVKTAPATTAAAYENKAGLSQKKLQELLDLFHAARDFGDALIDRLLRYIVDDVEDEAALEQLAGCKDAAHALQLGCASPTGFGPLPKTWAVLLNYAEPADPTFYLRLGKTFAAAARQLGPAASVCKTELNGAQWLDLLLQEATQTHPAYWSSAEGSCKIPASVIEALLAADGRGPEHFLTAPFKFEKTRVWETNKVRDMVLAVADLGKSWAAHRDLVVPFLMEGTADSRLVAVENLARAAAPPEPFMAELVAAATGSSKRLREAAESLIAKAPAAARPLLEAAACEAGRAEREQAVRLLGNICREEARPFLEQRLEAEPSAPVKEAIKQALGNFRTAPGTAGESLEPPVHVPLPADSEVTAALRACLQVIFDEYNEYAARHNEQVANKSPNTYLYPPDKLDTLGARDLDVACRLLADGGKTRGHFAKTLVLSRIHDMDSKRGIKPFLEHPDCRLIHVARLLSMIDELAPASSGRHAMMWQASTRIATWRRSHEPKITLRHLDDAFRQIGLPAEALVNELLGGYHSALEWEPEAVWPFLFGQLGRLISALATPSGTNWSDRWEKSREFDGALRLLTKFPHTPPAAIGRLWDLAIGSVKADRIRAQKAVETLPDLQERLAQALASGSYQTRSVAAEWLAKLGDKRGVPVLAAAARSEKQDAALDAILTALEKLGEPIEPFLDRKKLEADAAKGLKKGVPEAMSWFPWSGLPTVHWADTRKEIPPEVLTWLIVQTFKLKSPEAGPLLRRYCALMAAAEREELGKFVLSAWFDQDLKRKHTDAEARAQAKKQAPQTWQAYQQAVQWYQQSKMTPPASFHQTQQQVEEELFLGLCRECGSAVAEKGVLAVAGACSGDAAVAPVQKYLKEWYGYRAAQCKALIAMLSAVDRPAAIQYLLSIANRFRTKGIREEAEKYVNILAERKGWTLDELADRTMPTAGFEDDGTLELDFGPRKFVARVNSDLETVLCDPAGKVLKNLPDPRQDDDADLAKAAKASFSNAKKELKKFAGQQTTRLYEAMCTQRTWSHADWRMYLIGHPLLKFLCQRLVWGVCDGDAVTQTFRPLDDGTLTDSADEEVALSDDAKIRIAHGCQLPEAAADGWRKHLADYDVAPLFTQFGRVPYTLAAEKRHETSIDDFQGHMVEAFKLRGLATKAGYTRGETQDGGWFYDYQKMFPGLGLIVELNFSGNGLPEENRQVALTNLSFRKSAPAEAGMFMTGNLPLSDIPAVLLTECYNDMASIAKAGSGFDPDWEKKVH